MTASSAAGHGEAEDLLRLSSAYTCPSPFLAYELRDMLGNLRQINFGEISESDDSEFLFDVPREDRFVRRRPEMRNRKRKFDARLPQRDAQHDGFAAGTRV